MSHLVNLPPADDTGGNKKRRSIDDERFGPQPTSTSDLPDPELFAVNLTKVAVEIIAGLRDLRQIGRWATDDVLLSVRRESEKRALKMSLVPSTKRERRVPKFTVHRVRVTKPRDGVVEACMVVHGNRRPQAVALRLEGYDRRWRATSFTVV